MNRVVAAELSSAQAQAEGRESLGWHPSSTVSDNAPSPSPQQVETPCSRRQTEEVPSKNENDAYTVEDLGMFAMNPNPESAAATAASFQTQFTGFEQLDSAVIVEKSSTDQRRQSTSSSLSQDCVLPGNVTQESSKCVEEQNDPNSQDHELSFSAKPGTVSELDHDTTAMAYFLAGNEALGQDKGEWSEDSSDVVAVNEEEAGKQDSDLLDAMASESGLDLSAQNTHNNDGAVLSTDNANHQQSLLSHRVCVVPLHL